MSSSLQVEPSYNGGDCCFIGKIQTCEKVEFIGNQRRVTMVEACENNDERIDSDSDTIEIIVEKGMVETVECHGVTLPEQ
jgi:hypothetical protein